MNPETPHRPHVVYVMRNAAAEIIYVGMTADIKSRMRVHSSKSAWLGEVALIETHSCANRDEAAELEICAIAAWEPRHNVRHNPAAHGSRASKNPPCDDEWGEAA